MGLAGEGETEGIIAGIDFLREMQGERKPELSGTVVVVGGGNTAIDAARTALRRGAQKVLIVYRRTIGEMPAHRAEIEAALEEGIEARFLTTPVSIVARHGRIRALRCIRMELGQPDASGRKRPIDVAGWILHHLHSRRLRRR
jgi:formate dehydrogenase major subunit